MFASYLAFDGSVWNTQELTEWLKSLGTCPRILSLNKTFIQNQGNTSDFVEKISVDGDDDSESNDAFVEPFFLEKDTLFLTI